MKPIHGMSRAKEYAIWRGIKSRCSNPNVKAYHLYGGAGIKMCEKWSNSFVSFYEDMGPRPSPKHSIDRYPDLRGDYEPSNCRWASPFEQVNNRRNTRWVVYRGRQMPLADAVREAGSVVHREAAWIRIKTGWDAALALETPRVHLSGNSKELRGTSPRYPRMAYRARAA